VRWWSDVAYSGITLVSIRDEIMLGIPMGIARLVSLKWKWERERLDGNGRK